MAGRPQISPPASALPSRNAVRERRLLRAAARGDRGARDRVVAAHLGLVRSLAARYRNLGVPYDDLVQEGALGLLEAISRYDPSHGADFEAFARFRIRRAIRCALTDQARLVRLPKQIVERRRAIARVEARLVAANGRPATAAEVTAETGLAAETVEDARRAQIRVFSLDQPPGEEQPAAAATADARALDPEREALTAEDARLVHEAVGRLPRAQRVVVSRHFGLDGAPTAIAELAHELRLSEQRTRTIERDALRSLGDELVAELGRA